MRDQILELAALADGNDQNVSIITLNIRKNQYSDDGRTLAENWYGINVTWHWVEEYEPFTATGQYQQYWEVDGSFANPSLILIDPDLDVVGVYHVYCIGRGELDGVQTADSLMTDIEMIMAGDWGGFMGDVSTGITFGGMFVLGIVTSFSPCSILLFFTLISYIGSLREAYQEEEIPGKDWKKGLWIGLCFTLGMSLVFLMFGFLISYVGLFIEMSTVFYLVAGIILIILGLNAIKSFRELLSRLRPSKQPEEPGIDTTIKGGKLIHRLGRRSVYMTSFLLGILFSVGWAPCAISLVFPVVVLMLTQSYSLLMGGMLMFTFGLGHGIVVIPFCVATGEMKGRIGNRFISASKWIQMRFGLVIIVIGIIFALRFWDFNLW
jgi:cytochrome c-type biogenesis protein